MSGTIAPHPAASIWLAISLTSLSSIAFLPFYRFFPYEKILAGLSQAGKGK
jgi:hypothetical protein